MTIDAKTAELALPTLRLARQIISRPENWAQGISLMADTSKHCVATAITEARNQMYPMAVVEVASGEPEAITQYLRNEPANQAVAAMLSGEREAAIGIVAKIIPASYRSVIEWNDAPGRTHAEVLRLLDDAIDHCEDILFGCESLGIPQGITVHNRPAVAEALAMAHENNDWDMWHGDDMVDVQILQDEGPAMLYFHPVITVRNDEHLMTTNLQRLLGRGIVLHPAPELAGRSGR